MKTMGTLGMLVGIVAMASSALGSTRHVNCDVPGQTITKALKTAQPGDTIHVQGTCEETVTITTDRVTLDGGGRAVLQGPGGGNREMCHKASSTLWGCKGSKSGDSRCKTVLRTAFMDGRAPSLQYATSASSRVPMMAWKPQKPRRCAFWAPVRYAVVVKMAL